ncbi:MAG: hypothetical protein HXY30_18260 [Pseudorhodoplanes sp.]|nr:hypothetical protein [Pseudorhodoplanes sp.]
MSHSLRDAGPDTHIRIAAAALVAAIVVVAVGVSAQTPSTADQAHKARALLVVKAEPVQISRYGAVIR